MSGDDAVTYTSNILLFSTACFIVCNTTRDLECVNIFFNDKKEKIWIGFLMSFYIIKNIKNELTDPSVINLEADIPIFPLAAISFS